MFSFQSREISEGVPESLVRTPNNGSERWRLESRTSFVADWAIDRLDAILCACQTNWGSALRAVHLTHHSWVESTESRRKWLSGSKNNGPTALQAVVGFISVLSVATGTCFRQTSHCSD